MKPLNIEDIDKTKLRATTTPDKERELFDKEWDNTIIIGMLMVLSTNARSDVTYAVNQCTKFTHYQRNIHATLT